MNWLRDITRSEYLYITAFLVFYLAYAIRMYIISKKIRLSIYRLLLKFFLRSTYFSLFIIALLGPSFGDIKKEIKAIGKDIYFAIDLSTSMNATDINPTRLEKVKYELTNTLKNFNSDRVGLIIFSEEAVIQCPLTSDHSAVKLFLETLDPKLFSSGGTNLNAPLSLAYDKLNPSSESDNSKDQAKVLILVTDGENFGEQNPDEWLKKIKAAGIKLFILGIGSEQGGKIPTENGFKKNNSGQVIVSSLNVKKLKTMSETAGGKYYEITPETNDIKTMTNKILKIEGTLKGSRKIESAANKYFYFLFIAVILIILDVLISVKSIKI
jgi:Ca-activated chloride channel family protein